MKKISSLILFATLCINLNAQIILEHDYDSASSYASGAPAVMSQLMIIKFEVSGEKYVKINRWAKKIFIYNLNHSLQKIINCSNFPLTIAYTMGEVLYLSENLFNMDSKIEFIYGFSGTDSSNTVTNIYNEDGLLIFTENGAPIVRTNTPQQQFPIYNTLNGAKMILSYHNGHAKVFSLPGTLTTDIAKANNILPQQEGLSDAYPNPSINTTQIDYTLPNGINEGEIALFDLNGIEVKRFKVDRTFNTLLVSTSDLAAGTYYFQLQTSKQNSEGKKIVVIK